MSVLKREQSLEIRNYVRLMYIFIRLITTRSALTIVKNPWAANMTL